jgi:STE24 endopeptidase
MDTLGLLIAAVLVLVFLLDAVVDLLNLQALRTEAPRGFQDVFEPEEYRRSQEYTRVTAWFGLLVGSLRLLVLFIFWAAGGFDALDEAVRAWGLHVVVTGVLYISILFVGYSLLFLPFSLYATFVIEARFGFNRTTLGTFLADRAKGLLISAVLGVPLLAGVLALFAYAGDGAWIYSWGVAVLFVVFVQFIAPTWIMPLFNRFTPLEQGALRDAILSYAESVRFPLSNVFVIDGSRRSTRSNAFFTGMGRTKRIALFDTLVEQMTVSELVTVVAHEVGHYKLGHIRKGMAIAILQAGVTFFLLGFLIDSPALHGAFGVEQVSVYTGLVFFGILYTPIRLPLAVAVNAFSRRNEAASDRFATETTHDPSSLARALKKLAANNLSNLTPHPLYVLLNYSHPPLVERVRALQGSKV